MSTSSRDKTDLLERLRDTTGFLEQRELFAGGPAPAPVNVPARVAGVAVAAPIRHLLSYSVPDSFAIEPGVRVLAPLGSRVIEGFVVTIRAGSAADAVLRLEKHAEFSESVAGWVSREVAGQIRKAQLAGDIEDGFLTLDESSNGISITGTWNGEMVIGSCGKKFTGTWKDTSDHAPADTPDIPFTLEKLPGW